MQLIKELLVWGCKRALTRLEPKCVTSEEPLTGVTPADADALGSNP